MAIKVGEIFESYRANEFVLEINGAKSPGISKVSGLSEGEVDTIEQPDGGTNHVYKISATKIKYDSLTIERYMDGSEEDKRFLTWFQDSFAPKEKGQGSSSSRVRRSVSIIKYHNGEEVIRFVVRDAWVKSSKFGDLEAGSTNTWKQTIVLEHEGLERAV